MSSQKNIALVLGAFHRTQVERMRVVANEVAQSLGLTVVAEVWVHGSLEKPLALKRLLLKPEIDGAIALGIIERGETKHGLVMGQAVMSSLLSLQLDLMKPIGVGILGPEILPEQITPRLEPYAREAVIALSEMLSTD